MIGGQFIKHCQDNNLEGVRDCLSRGVDVNTMSEDGRWSGLTIAAKKNYIELLEILLSHHHIKVNNTTTITLKINYTTKKEHQWTALLFACGRGNSAIVSRLVQVPGLKINYQDETGATAAHWCTRKYGHDKSLKILAKTGKVDWNKKNHLGWTPLYPALVNCHSDMVDIIMQQPNIDYNVQTRDGTTLGYAAVWGDMKDADIIGRQFMQFRKNKLNTGKLAAQERFTSWNIPCEGGDTPLMIALEEDAPTLADILIQCPRVDLRRRDRKGWSLVFRLIQSNQLGEI